MILASRIVEERPQRDGTRWLQIEYEWEDGNRTSALLFVSAQGEVGAIMAAAVAAENAAAAKEAQRDLVGEQIAVIDGLIAALPDEDRRAALIKERTAGVKEELAAVAGG